jgi:hypothetical protein
VHDGRLVSADHWSDEPVILSAGLGFDIIIGVEPLDAETVRAVGGTWDIGLLCTNRSEPGVRERTSASGTPWRSSAIWATGATGPEPPARAARRSSMGDPRRLNDPEGHRLTSSSWSASLPPVMFASSVIAIPDPPAECPLVRCPSAASERVS